MYCTTCGKQIADEALFCPYCGKPTGQGAATAAGAAKGVGTAGGAAGTGATGTGTAAAAGGLGALKTGLIALAAVTVVGLGAYGAAQIVSRSDEPQEASAMEDDIDQEELERADEPEELETPVESEEPQETQELTPTDEALEQYRIIISQADSYEYGEYAEIKYSWQEFAGYRYALVQMQPEDPVPTLLLEWDMLDTEQSVHLYYARVFQYDPDTKTVRQPTEVMGDGGIRGGLSMAGDGDGIFSTGWGGTGAGSVSRYTLDGDSLNRDTYWTGNIFEKPDSITFIEIEWHEVEDLSALDSWTALEPSGAALTE